MFCQEFKNERILFLLVATVRNWLFLDGKVPTFKSCWYFPATFCPEMLADFCKTWAADGNLADFSEVGSAMARFSSNSLCFNLLQSKMPFLPPEKPPSNCERARIALRKRPNEDAKEAKSQRERATLTPRKSLFRNRVWPLSACFRAKTALPVRLNGSKTCTKRRFCADFSPLSFLPSDFFRW